MSETATHGHGEDARVQEIQEESRGFTDVVRALQAVDTELVVEL